MTIQIATFGGTDYSLETLGNLSGPELVKLHNNCAGLTEGFSETKRFADKGTALKRTWAVLRAYDEQNQRKQRSDEAIKTLDEALPPAAFTEIQEPHVTPAPELPAERDSREEHTTMASAARKKSTPSKSKAEPVARGFAEDQKIKILVKENPRRGAAAERFEIYKNGMTVAEYTKKIGSRAEALVHLRWDVNKGHISVN